MVHPKGKKDDNENTNGYTDKAELAWKSPA
jgi:hypothetical protein